MGSSTAILSWRLAVHSRRPPRSILGRPMLRQPTTSFVADGPTPLTTPAAPRIPTPCSHDAQEHSGFAFEALRSEVAANGTAERPSLWEVHLDYATGRMVEEWTHEAWGVVVPLGPPQPDVPQYPPQQGRLQHPLPPHAMGRSLGVASALGSHALLHDRRAHTCALCCRFVSVIGKSHVPELVQASLGHAGGSPQ